MAVNDNIHRIRVFISSRCGGKYTIARQALRTILEATGLFEVYVFENEPASSINTQSAYLESLDQSNLCVFIIDNADDVSPAVQSEINRARELQLKQIYIFCDENKKEPTILQNEIKESLSQKYKTVHEFSDIVEMVFTSVIQDVLAVYKQKRETQENKQNDELFKGRQGIQGERGVYREDLFCSNVERIASSIVSKTLMENIYDPRYDKLEESSDLDILIADHLQVVLARQQFRAESCSKLGSAVISTVAPELKELLQIRYEALVSYFTADYDRCLELLQKALQASVNDYQIPYWIALDIAIDIRHVCWRIDEKNNRVSLSNIGQDFLDESSIPVYYPYLDRESEEFYRKTTKRYYKELNKPPKMIEFGGIKEIFEDLASVFYIAVLHGSIVQSILVRERMIEALSMLSTLYDEHEFIKELIRLEIVNADVGALEWTLRSNLITAEKLSYTDLRNYAQDVNNIPDPLQKRKAQYSLMGKLGYYMEDALFSTLFNELFDFAMEWTSDNLTIVSLGNYIFDFFRGTIHRTDQGKAIHFIEAIFNNGLSRFYIDSLKLICEIDISRLTKDNQRILREIFNNLFEGKYQYSGIDNYIANAFTRFCRKATIPTKRIENQFMRKASNYNVEAFNLELALRKGKDPIEFVHRYLETAQSRNEEQGLNGKHIGYASEPYDIIYNILKYDNRAISKDLAYQIARSVLATLSAEKQTVRAKKSAVKLLQLLYFRTHRLKIWKDICQDLLENEEIYSEGYVMLFLENDNNDHLRFVYSLFCSAFDLNHVEKTVDQLCSIGINENNLMIDALTDATCFLADAKKDLIDDRILAVLQHISMLMVQHREKQIRISATKCLIELTQFDSSKNMAIRHLSRVMDCGSSEEKTWIVDSLRQSGLEKTQYGKGVINKGLADNNYIVRLIAKRNNA